MYLKLLLSFLLILATSVPHPSGNIQMKRKIKYIVIHCTATRENQRLSEEELEKYHRSLGYNRCGYHYYIRRDGNVIAMRPLEKVGAHVKGYNTHSIGIAYEGGLNYLGFPQDTRTLHQRNSLQTLIASLKQDYPLAKVLGHRDLSPDIDNNGRIEPDEWIKSCPCFEVSAEY